MVGDHVPHRITTNKKSSEYIMTIATHTITHMPHPATMPRLAVFGDVHGCYAQFLAAIKYGQHHADHTIFVGDYIDRGPNSAKCFALYLKYLYVRPAGLTLLPGNHEQILFGSILSQSDKFLNTAAWPKNGCQWWTDYASKRTPAGSHDMREHRAGARLGVIDALVADGGLDRDTATKWLDHACELWAADEIEKYYQQGHVLVVHAGVDPRAADPIDWINSHSFLQCNDMHPLWIRDEFLHHEGPYGDSQFTIVHGHTKTKKAHANESRYRFNVDAHAYGSGILQGIIVDGTNMQRITVAV